MARKYTPAAGKRTARYKAGHYKRIVIDALPEDKERIKAAADEAKESMQAYIMKATMQRIENEAPSQQG